MKSLESMCSSRTIRWVGLIVGCLNVAASGSLLAANAFINDLKEVFNLTQSNAELIIAVEQVGGSFGPPVGFVLDRYGPLTSFISALVLGLGSCLLLFSCPYSISFYHNNFWLIAIYAFVFGYATIVMNLTATSVNMANFKCRHRGKVMAIMGASWFSGPAVFSAIYTKAFSGSNNIGGFFLLLAIVIFVTNLLAAIFVKDYSHLVGESVNEDQKIIVQSDGSDIQGNNGLKSKLGLNLCRMLDFHLMSWAFFLSVGAQLMLINNIAVYLDSYHLSDYTTALLITGPIAAAVTMIALGVFSDYFIASIPRATFVAAGTIFQTFLTMGNINNGGNIPLFGTTVVVLYICNALYFSLFPTLIGEFFGMKYFSRNWGGLVLAMAFTTLGLMAVFGALYDKHADAARKCFGNICFRDNLIVGSVLSLFSLVCISVMVWRERRWRETKLYDYVIQ